MKRLNLKFARIRKDLSQKDLAKKAGLTAQMISDYEGGRANPSYEVMKRIADILGGTVDELFYQDVKEAK